MPGFVLAVKAFPLKARSLYRALNFRTFPWWEGNLAYLQHHLDLLLKLRVQCEICRDANGSWSTFDLCCDPLLDFQFLILLCSLMSNNGIGGNIQLKINTVIAFSLYCLAESGNRLFGFVFYVFNLLKTYDICLLSILISEFKRTRCFQPEDQSSETWI
jgi:hypothetical protein